jgi:hypothetical protein
MQQSDHIGRPFWDNLAKINSLKMTFSAGDAVSHQYKKSHMISTYQYLLATAQNGKQSFIDAMKRSTSPFCPDFSESNYDEQSYKPDFDQVEQC